MKEFSENHWESIQAKTFTKWVNDKLVKGGYPPISNIYTDFEDGLALGGLLTVLLKTSFLYNKKPFTRIQKVENLEVLLKQIKKHGVVLINIGPEDIVDGNRKLILGLIWTLISKLSISEIGAGDLSVRDELLRWCREATKKYQNVNIVDLSRSWQDGLGFNALIHNFRPDLLDYSSLKECERYKNLEQAFNVADKKLGIPRLLDVEDVADVIRPDEKSMITYLSQYYQKFNSMERERNSKMLATNILNKIDWSLQHTSLYEAKARAFIQEEKILEQKREELDNLLKETIRRIQQINSHNSALAAAFVELHTIHSSINALHKMYNFKPYRAPEDLAISKIKYEYKTSLESAEVLRSLLEDEDQGALNAEIKDIASSVDQENMKEVAEVFKKSLLKAYSSEKASEDAKTIRGVLKHYLEFLNELSKEESHRDEVMKNAISIYNKMVKEKGSHLSSNDLKVIFNRVGIVVDDSVLSMLDTIEGEESFKDTIRVLTINNYDSLNVKKALRVISGGSETINLQDIESGLENLSILSGPSKKIEIEKLVKEFIKE
ncbi:Alpha-actinin-like protein 1 [Nosema granulosis]|uniref:Alpha-actinin-like protein 1 n=1 Tax=Nosema granulosis TaxID=83296 RepID=A0A9P6GZF6_9MICR|nr:Alpha-actinin-like protein 1 [Nosema granulosis]